MVILLAVAIFTVVHFYRSTTKDQFLHTLTSEESEGSSGTLGQKERVEHNAQLDGGQEGPAQRRRRRRVMALSYREQLNSALKYEMFSLATLVADLGASVVEPVVVNSRMYGCREVVPTLDRPHVDTALPLSSVIDVRTPLRNCAGVEVEPLQSILWDPPGKVVLVYAQTHKIGIHPREINVPLRLQSELTEAMESQNHSGVLQCSNLFLREGSNVLKMIESSLSHYMPSHSISQVVCFSGSKVINSSELLIALPDDEDLLIVFSSWRGCYIFDCSRENYHRYTHTGKFNGPGYAMRPNQDRFKLITHHSLTNYQQCTESPLPHSTLVTTLASKYLKEVVKLQTQYVSVHIRTEIIANTATRLCRDEAAIQALVSRLLQSLHNTVTAVLERNPSYRVLVCTDNGRYGTDSLGTLGRSIANHMHAVMTKSFGWSIIHFNPTSLGLRERMNGGLVSLIEMNILMKGDHLVVAGHGNFQQQLISHYLQRRNASTVDRIPDSSISCKVKKS